MISSIPALVNTFSDYLSKTDYFSAYHFAIKNNLLFSHLDKEGKSCAYYIRNTLQPHLKDYNKIPTTDFIKHITPLLDYLLDKEPHYWYYKKSVGDDKNEPYTFLLTYMVFNNKEKVEYFLCNMDKDSVNTSILKSHYLNNRNIDFNMVNVIETALLPEKINLKDLINLQTTYPCHFKDSLAIYENHRNNNKISYKHDDAVKLLTHIFDRRTDYDIEKFIQTLDQTLTFLKPLLIKNYVGYSNEGNARYIDIFQRVFQTSVEETTNNSFSFDKSFIVPALTILKTHFPDTHIFSYLKNSYLQMNTLQSLAIEVDLSKPDLKQVLYDETQIKTPLYVINLNNDYLREITKQYFNTYFVLILINKLKNKYIDEDLSLKYARIEDYQQNFPEQFKEDWSNFKKGLNLLQIPLESKDKDLNSYLQYLNLDNHVNTKDQVKTKKLKI